MIETYTAFCSFPDSPRGQYDEEIDVQATSVGKARKLAMLAINESYDKRLKVRRVIKRGPGLYW